MPFVPHWQGPIEGYTVNQAHKHLWRVTATHDFDDLMQEARIVYLRCERKYRDLTEAKHLTAFSRTGVEVD